MGHDGGMQRRPPMNAKSGAARDWSVPPGLLRPFVSGRLIVVQFYIFESGTGSDGIDPFGLFIRAKV